MIKLMELENLFILMEQHIMENGEMINKKEMGLKFGQTDLNTKDNSIREKNMEKVNSYGLTDQVLLESLLIIILKDKEIILGQMVEDILENG